jgi:hypothetical protein
MAAMNYFFSNMTNTVIFMTLGDLESATQWLFRLAPFTYECEYWLFMSSKFHVGGGRNICRGKPQMSAFSSHICVYM